jgi:hypothetical protein
MKRFTVYVICAVFAFVVAGCSPGPADRGTGAAGSTPEAAGSPLPESGYKASITVVVPPPPTMHPGEKATVKARVKNMGNVAWPALVPGAKYRVTLGNHWLDKSGKTVIGDDGRAELPHDVKAGEEVELTLAIKAPRDAGDYILDLDMVHETLSWFIAHGSQNVKINIKVQ